MGVKSPKESAYNRKRKKAIKWANSYLSVKGYAYEGQRPAMVLSSLVVAEIRKELKQDIADGTIVAIYDEYKSKVRRCNIPSAIQASKNPRKKKLLKRTAQSKEQFNAFYQSKEWRRLRYKALKIHGPKCQLCGATREDGKKMHVDHIKPRFKHPKLELEITNLQILCEDCNMGKGGWDETDWRPNTG